MSDAPISRNKAVGRLLQTTKPMDPVAASPFDAIAHVAASNVTAHCSVPEQAVSVRDGYAVRLADIKNAAAMNPVRLKVTQTLRAETKNPVQLESGDAARVLTGGMIPPCADSVLADEDVKVEDDIIIVTAPVREGWFIRTAGNEINHGATITEAGHTVTPQSAAVMIRTRVSSVMMHPKPNARVLSLGSELSDPLCEDLDCETARFPADNLVMTRGLLEQSNANVTETGVLQDNEDALISILSQPDLPEIVITTGGTGRSERDFARSSAQKSGFTTLFNSLNIRPGRNMFAAQRDNTLLFGLPGPPAAVFVCFHAVILPVIRRLRGLPNPTEPIRARFTEGLSAKPGSEWLVQCALSFKGSSIMATPLVGKDVPSMVGLGKAHGLAVIPDGDAILPDGEAEVLSTLF